MCWTETLSTASESKEVTTENLQLQESALERLWHKHAFMCVKSRRCSAGGLTDHVQKKISIWSRASLLPTRREKHRWIIPITSKLPNRRLTDQMLSWITISWISTASSLTIRAIMLRNCTTQWARNQWWNALIQSGFHGYVSKKQIIFSPYVGHNL